MLHVEGKAKDAPAAGVVGKVFGTIFLLAFFAAGTFFLVLLVRELAAAAQTYVWPGTACEILASEVEEKLDEENPYVFRVQYRYLWEGQTYTSEQAALKARRFSDYRQAQRLVTRYPVEAGATCYVNPNKPAQAVLLREGLWFGLFLLVPLLFMFLAGGGLYLVWRSDPRSGAAAPEKRQEPLSGQAQATKTWGCLAIFFLLFFSVGSAFFHQLFLRPVWKVLTAGNWVETPCLVESSRVRAHRGDESTTYSVDILYHYVFNDREYKSSRYDFMGGSTSSYHGKAAVVSRYPPGKETICYVNPTDPTEAVLNREFSADLWVGLIPLVFVAVGAGGLLFAVLKSRRPRTALGSEPSGWSRRGGEATLRPGTVEGVEGPVVLRTRHSAWAKLLGTIFMAAFWNGIVSVFVWQVIQAWHQGRGSWAERWFLPIFLMPFVLVGLLLIGTVVYTFLALFNPRFRLTVSSSRITPGDNLEVQWYMDGRVQVVERLRIYLEGREEATYTRGTDTRTDKVVFATIDLVHATSRADFRSGQARISIPANTMPTFEAPHNKILWTIQVRGEIARWPDVIDEFPIRILPSQPQPARQA
jgi:hypothetical protein